MDQINYTDVGAIAIIFMFFIKEFFGFMKAKRNGNGNGKYDGEILKQLELMNSNHLHSLENAIRDGNKELIEVIHRDNVELLKMLGEIKGQLR